MGYERIRKSRDHRQPSPNLADYHLACHTFSWPRARAALQGLPDGGLNIAHEAVDRHASSPSADKLALVWLGQEGERRHLTYRELAALSSRFANVLRGLKIEAGQRVFAMLGSSPELSITALGTLKNRGVFCALPPTLHPEPLQQRLDAGEARVLVTTTALYQRAAVELRATLPRLEHVLLVAEPGQVLPRATVDFARLLGEASAHFVIPSTSPDELALLLFTGGTTGRPRGLLHTHGAAVALHLSASLALDLHSDDVAWCTADPAWLTGLTYGLVAPLMHGATVVATDGPLSAERCYRTLEREAVSVWYSTPAVLREVMSGGVALAREHDLNRLRLVASAGEPLSPELALWGSRVLGQPVHDTWWQAETGSLMIANYRAMDIKAGSMGRPLPGVEAAVVRADGDHVAVIDEPGVDGQLAFKVGWPGLFEGYLVADAQPRQRWGGQWYLSGDIVRRDADGYYWFVGRAEDLIKTAGRTVGPFEIESALREHAAVADAAVIGVPHPPAAEVTRAFVCLHPGQLESDSLAHEILAMVRKKLGSALAPRQLSFVPALPRTESGTVLRRLLKARALGTAEGDLSTLERRSH